MSRSWIINLLAVGGLFVTIEAPALDSNNNQMSDIWELVFNAQGLLANADTDGDGFLNVQEALAGTDPFDFRSRPALSIAPAGTNSLLATWSSAAGKLYDLRSSADLESWQSIHTSAGNGSPQSFLKSLAGESSFFLQVLTSDQPSENAQLSNWEKITLGFSPTSAHTERYDFDRHQSHYGRDRTERSQRHQRERDQDSPLDLGRGRLIPTTSADDYFAEMALWLGVSKTNLPLVLPNIGNFYNTASSAPPLGFLL